MRRIILVIGAYFLTSLPLAFPQSTSFDQQVATLMKALLARIPAASDTARIYLQPPVYLAQETETSAEHAIGGPFAHHLRIACQAALGPSFHRMHGDELSQIWSNVNLAQVIASHDPDQILHRLQSLDTSLAAVPLDAILLTAYREWEGNPQQIEVNLHLLDVRRMQKYTVAGTLSLTREQVSEASARPFRLEDIRHQMAEISHIVGDEIEQAELSGEILFDLFVTVDKGPGAVYEDGARLKIQVSAEIDCYIAVANVDAEGQVHLLFPNAYERDNFMHAGQERQIPAPDMQAYNLTIGAPFGIETIKVIASQTPFPADTAFQAHKDLNLVPFPLLGTRVDEGMHTIREWAEAVLVQQKQQTRLAEAQCLFTTIPRSSRGIWQHEQSR